MSSFMTGACGRWPVLQHRDNGSFRNIGGVGDHKLEKYGPAFIEAIRAFHDNRETDRREHATPGQPGPGTHETRPLTGKLFETRF